MVLHGIWLLCLSDALQKFVLEAIKKWYADYDAIVGWASYVSFLVEPLTRIGPEYGSFPEHAKLIFIVP